MNTQLNAIDRKIEFQAEVISELGVKVEVLTKEKEDQKAQFLQLEEIEKIKYEELEKKFLEMASKSKEYQSSQEEREIDDIEIQLKLSQDLKEEEDTKMYMYLLN